MKHLTMGFTPANSRASVHPPGCSGTVRGDRARSVTELDGVRGIAILLVLVTHFGAYADPQAGGVMSAFEAFIGMGWAGVDLFFVLSGCLITGILLDAKGSPHYFRAFYMRRILRVMPLYYASLFAYFCVLLPLAGLAMPDRVSVAEAIALSSFSEQLWYWLHLSNWRIGFDAGFPGLHHFWSLAVEEQFYLVWPVLVLLLSESMLMRVCCCCIAGSLILRNVPEFQQMQLANAQVLYCLTPFRMDALAVGACVALLARRSDVQHLLPRLAAGSVLVGGVTIAAVILHEGSVSAVSPSMSRVGFTGIAFVGGSIVLYAMMRAGSADPIARLLRNPMLVSFGKYSYGMYVLHPALWILGRLIVPKVGEYVGPALAYLIAIVAGVAASYAVALCSWNLLEKRFLRMKDRFPYRPAAQSQYSFLALASAPHHQVPSSDGQDNTSTLARAASGNRPS